MIKYLYKGIILLCIFAGSLYYFGRDIKEDVFNVDKTINMSETSFPIITIKLGEEEVNLLHGYGNTIDANLFWESITPLDEEHSFEVIIDEKENDVKRVIYELRSQADNKLIETNTINALEKEGENKKARVKFKTELKADMEYAVKITLITSESRKINYYTRVKKISDSYLSEKLEFVMNFHDSIMDKDKAEDIIVYLEPKADADNTTLAKVDIHSSFELISWGTLSPQLVGTIVPTIENINSDTGSILLQYMIKADTDSGTEYYYIKEFYRVRYTNTRMYLLNYDRTMEAAFDMSLTSLTKSEFKIGISNETDLDLVTSSDNNKLSFVRQRELWYYNLVENSMVKVFSFRQEETDYIRDIYGEHDVKILNMDEDGNINFMVFGYMNRGVYEGRVGIVLYKYYSSENRIEELVYIPMNTTYQILKEELDSFSYVNKLDVFYFSLNRQIYAYNLITKNLSVIASHINGDNFIVSMKKHYIAWENNSNPKEATEIIILDLESGNEHKIEASSGNNINLLGKIDDNLIYGFAKTTDISIYLDGSILFPMYQIEIADSNNNILKEYQKEGYYVIGTTIQDNVITLERVKKEKQNGEDRFVTAAEDNILNKVTQVTKAFELTKRVTEKTLTEFYISLPLEYTIKEIPSYNTTSNTIITEDTTLRLEDTINTEEYFAVYSHGEIEGIYEKASEAINTANERIGLVINNRQQIVWERGIRSSLKELTNIKAVYVGQNRNSLTACAQMLLTYKGGFTPTNLGEGTVYEIIKPSLGDSVLNLTGCTLEETLYFVNKNRPVIAMKNESSAVLIIGYDAYNIIVIDPTLQKTMKIGLNDGTAMFKEAGNLFFSYLPDNQ